MTAQFRFISVFILFLVNLLILPFSALQAAGSIPSAPENLTGAISDGVASLAWDIPADDDSIEGYNVYVNNEYAATVATNSIDIDVDEDTLYIFFVVAFDEEPRLYSQASASLTLPESLIPEDLTIPPSAPSDLTGSTDDDTLTLNWQPSTDDEAVVGYNVYRDNQYETTVSTTSYTTVDDGERHSWHIVAFDIRTNFSARSERIVLPDPGPVDTTLPPSVPMGLTGSVQTGEDLDTVTIDWEPSTDDQAVSGYNIYENGQYIATRLSNQYIGSVAAGSSNGFTIVSFDYDGNFSSSSSTLFLPSGSEPVDPGLPPTVPEGLIGDVDTSDGQAQVTLFWEASTSTAGVAGYNVYLNDDYLKTVLSPTFTDTVSGEDTFTYSVVAFDQFGNYSAKSSPLTLLADVGQPPFFSDLDDQTLYVDQPWELVLRPVDVDGDAVGIAVADLPADVEFIDNMDGSRSLAWTPGTDDTGSYEIILTAFDLLNVDLQTTQTITLEVLDDRITPDPTFSLSIAQAPYNLLEGSDLGVNIPITVQRGIDSTSPITLTAEPDNPVDGKNITSSFSIDTLSIDDTQSELYLALGIDVLPIAPHQRRYLISATDGVTTETVSVTMAVTPVARDDIYLLIGQSNMVGFSEDDAKQAAPGGVDERNPRIRQANVERNHSALYATGSDYTDISVNFRSPAFVLAEDPLHEPVDPDTLTKTGTRIGMPMSFAKQAILATTRNIVLVPAAWPSSGFCDTQVLSAHWNPLPTTNPVLGNTLLFDRAVARVNQTLQETGGILRGILWHQGESDEKAECAPFYEDNLIDMVAQLRTVIDEDARGSQARGPQANIPFIAGTMSKGIDERGDFSEFLPGKSTVDSVHRNIASLIPFSDVVLNDDLVPANGYPCGENSCIHFGAAALREMGARAFTALTQAAQNQEAVRE